MLSNAIRTQVLVVGAGPGGCSAAWHLSKNGIEVLIIDKARFPRDKTCGDGVAPRAVVQLNHIGLGDWLNEHRRIEGIRFYSAKAPMVRSKYPMDSSYIDHSFVIPRIELDAKLVSHVREGGVEIMEGVSFEHISKKRENAIRSVRAADERGKTFEIEADYIIGADGPLSRVGGSMGLLSEGCDFTGISVRCYMEGVEELSNDLEIYPEDAILPAAGWIFPVSENTANVGVGIMLKTLRKKGMNIKRIFDAFLKESVHASQKLRNAQPVGKLKGAVLRVGMRGSALHSGNVLLVGDAAAMTNPISGEGISYALESGRWAAETIKASVENGDTGVLCIYPEMLKARYAEYFKKGLFAIRWGDNKFFMRMLLEYVGKRQNMADKMSRYLMNMRRSEPPIAPPAWGIDESRLHIS